MSGRTFVVRLFARVRIILVDKSEGRLEIRLLEDGSLYRQRAGRPTECRRRRPSWSPVVTSGSFHSLDRICFEVPEQESGARCSFKRYSKCLTRRTLRLKFDLRHQEPCGSIVRECRN